MRDIVRFQANIPAQVTLEYATGKLCTGTEDGKGHRRPDQYYYSLTGNRAMYVEPVVEHQIRQLGIQPGEEFEICKRDIKEGRAHKISWHVGFQGQPNGSPHGELAVPKLVERSPGAKPATAPTQQQQQPPSPQSPAATATQLNATRPSGTNPDSLVPGQGVHPASPVASRRDRMADLLTECLQAVSTASERTGTKLDSEQVQDLVSTLYISERKLEDELRYKYAGTLPPARPAQRTNGAIQ